ncbi:hypothetical protein MKX01_029643 [Papaver californicum]|nr:hypothetical protein MKX01_029643 [Papaver californicum]
MERPGSNSSMVSRNGKFKNVRVIGIDLCTIYNRVGFWIGQELIIRKISSCIAFSDYTEPVIGFETLDEIDKNPINTVVDIKRLIGARFLIIADPISNNDEPNVIVRSFSDTKRFSGEELFLVLENADVITTAVINVPSCFNNAQRLATKNAATICGRSKRRLRFACEDAKILLCDFSNVTQATVYVDSYYVLPLSTEDVPFKLFDKSEEAIAQCLRDTWISRFHQVSLVGGSSKIGELWRIISFYCNAEGTGIKPGLCKIMDPDKAVVQGAAIQATILSGETLMNPLLNGCISIEDVAPLILSARGQGLTLHNLIPRNTMIPSEIKSCFTTIRNKQRRLYLTIHEGEEATMKDNNLIGYFIFDGIQQATTEMGLRNITLSFVVDDDGILNVSADDEGSRRKLARQVVITHDELNKIVADMEKPAQKVEEEESKRKKRLEATFVLHLSFGHALFRFLKSMHIRTPPVFLGTITMLEIHYGYFASRITPRPSSF